ncbi:hypothetical protein VPH49_22125 [Pseudomonas luteola]|uniref:hypothetical protein n=1 Tax=Pseudomonas luteola TaxID=47886 RepID=UPI003A84F619
MGKNDVWSIKIMLICLLALGFELTGNDYAAAAMWLLVVFNVFCMVAFALRDLARARRRFK